LSNIYCTTKFFSFYEYCEDKKKKLVLRPLAVQRAYGEFLVDISF